MQIEALGVPGSKKHNSLERSAIDPNPQQMVMILLHGRLSCATRGVNH